MSEDGGQTWSRPQLAGVPREWLRNVTADPSVPGRVYATGEDGLYRSGDGGKSWQRIWEDEPRQVHGRPVLSSLVGRPRIDPVDSSIYLTINFYCLQYECVGGNVVKSSDGAATWEPLGLAGRMARHLVIAPGRRGLLYAAVNGPDVPWPEKGEASLYRSRDGGTTWERVLDNNWFVALAVDPSDGDTLYGAVTWRFWTPMGKSTDGGKSWTPLFPSGIRDDEFHVNVLVVDPSAPHIVYAGTTIGVLRSTNGGRTWSEFSNGLPERCSVRTLTAARDTPVLYAGVECNPSPQPAYDAIFGIDRFAGMRRRAVGR